MALEEGLIDMPPSQSTFPFSAIVGQESLKTALLLCAIDPGIGGVLVRGEKGTAKSTAVRALADILSHGTCRNVPVVELPLNATEDRLLSGIDLELTAKSGKIEFQPGLLQAAHGGFLYVDEVNLLDDRLADIILDASASGMVHVEREGISCAHPARFVLVGTMNPEEGELRPQLLDRFGLCVDVNGLDDPAQRVELMQRREAFDLDPTLFRSSWARADAAIAASMSRAQKFISSIIVSNSVRTAIAQRCEAAHSAGHRAEITLEYTARALAALRGLLAISEECIDEAAHLVFAHRKRNQKAPAPPPPHKPPEHKPSDSPGNRDNQGDSREKGDQGNSDFQPQTQADSTGAIEEKIFAIGALFKPRRIPSVNDRYVHGGSGRRTRTRAGAHIGRQIATRISHGIDDLSIPATLRAAAPFQRERKRPAGSPFIIHSADYRIKLREKRIGNYLIFVVDASGSMGARQRMVATKGAIQSLLLDSYRMRDKVAMVTFRKQEAHLVLPPGNSIVYASRLLAELPTGGRTPLAKGLLKGYDTARNCLLRNQAGRPVIMVITDGRANASATQCAVPIDEAFTCARNVCRDERISWIVIDTEAQGEMTFGLAKQLSEILGAHYFKIDDLRAEELTAIAKEFIHA